MLMVSSGGRQKIRACLAATLLLATLSGCAGGGDKNDDGSMFDGLFATDLTAKKPQQIKSGGSADPGGAPSSQVYAGTGAAGVNPTPGLVVVPGAASGKGSTSGTYDLNFENADISVVVKALLGDVLAQNYSIDPRVQGSISLSSARPVTRADILPLLESTLKVANAAVVKDGPLYRIVPMSEAIGSGPTDRVSTGAPEPGYGISVLRLKYVSAPTVIRVIESFAARPGAVRVEPGTNLVIVQGSSTERASAIEAALALDVDFLKNQSVGIYPVKNATPEALINELQSVMGTGEGGTAQGLVKFVAVSRLNAVLAIAKTREQINEVTAWVSRLDAADYGNTSLRVYRVRFGSAKVIAGLLNEIFTGKAGTPGTSDLSQLTPGASAQRSTSGFGSGGTDSGSSSGSGSGFQISNNSSGDGADDDGSDSDSGSASAASGTGTSNGSTTPTPGTTSGPGPFPNVRISADIGNNALLIFASREQYRTIQRAIEDLDKAPLQVSIDTIIAEVSLQNDLQYGVQYFLQSSDLGLGKNNGSIGFTGSGNNQKQALQRLLPGFNLVLGPDKDPRVILSALKQVTNVKVLSSPSLVVLDNQPATLQVGDQVPVPGETTTSATTGTVTSTEYRNTGVILSVTPRVNANGVVSLDVEQEISNVASETRVGNTVAPTISQRRVKSSIAVASGQTVVLGGLIQERQEKSRSSIPVLGDLKGIGDLFANTSTKMNRSELILFIRPQIIRDGVDAQLVAEELRSKVRLLGGGTARTPLQ